MLTATRGMEQAHDLPWTLRTDPQAPAGQANPSGEEQWLDLIRTYLTSYGGNRASEELLEKVEKLLIVEALRRSNGNQTHAARLLGLPRPTLHAKMQALRNAWARRPRPAAITGPRCPGDTCRPPYGTGLAGATRRGLFGRRFL